MEQGPEQDPQATENSDVFDTATEDDNEEGFETPPSDGEQTPANEQPDSTTQADNDEQTDEENEEKEVVRPSPDKEEEEEDGDVIFWIVDPVSQNDQRANLIQMIKNYIWPVQYPTAPLFNEFFQAGFDTYQFIPYFARPRVPPQSLELANNHRLTRVDPVRLEYASIYEAFKDTELDLECTLVYSQDPQRAKIWRLDRDLPIVYNKRDWEGRGEMIKPSNNPWRDNDLGTVVDYRLDMTKERTCINSSVNLAVTYLTSRVQHQSLIAFLLPNTNGEALLEVQAYQLPALVQGMPPVLPRYTRQIKPDIEPPGDPTPKQQQGFDSEKHLQTFVMKASEVLVPTSNEPRFQVSLERERLMKQWNAESHPYHHHDSIMTARYFYDKDNPYVVYTEFQRNGQMVLRLGQESEDGKKWALLKAINVDVDSINDRVEVTPAANQLWPIRDSYDALAPGTMVTNFPYFNKEFVTNVGVTRPRVWSSQYPIIIGTIAYGPLSLQTYIVDAHIIFHDANDLRNQVQVFPTYSKMIHFGPNDPLYRVSVEDVFVKNIDGRWTPRWAPQGSRKFRGGTPWWWLSAEEDLTPQESVSLVNKAANTRVRIVNEPYEVASVFFATLDDLSVLSLTRTWRVGDVDKIHVKPLPSPVPELTLFNQRRLFGTLTTEKHPFWYELKFTSNQSLIFSAKGPSANCWPVETEPSPFPRHPNLKQLLWWNVTRENYVVDVFNPSIEMVLNVYHPTGTGGIVFSSKTIPKQSLLPTRLPPNWRNQWLLSTQLRSDLVFMLTMNYNETHRDWRLRHLFLIFK